MAIGLSDILSALQNGVTAIQALQRQLAVSFPSVTAPSSVAPAVGTITYNSSQVAAFGLMQTSSGGVYRIALLPSS
jgi:hydroxymethylglutaryl-CoA reductase